MQFLLACLIGAYLTCMPFAQAAGSTLTKAELFWLAEHPEIRVAITTDYAPISFTNARGKHQGIAADYLAIIEKKLKHQYPKFHFKAVFPNDIQRAANDPKIKQVDVVPSFAQTPERLKYWLFSKPYINLPLYLVVRNEVNTNYSLQLAQKDTIAVVSYYAAEEFLMRDYPKMSLVPVASTQMGLQKVAFGEAKAFITDLPSASWWADQAGLLGLKPAAETAYQYKIGFATRADWPVLNNIIEKALSGLTKAEHEEIHRRWFIGPFLKKPLYQDWKFWLITSILFVCAVVIARLMRASARNKRRLFKQNNTLISLSNPRLGTMPVLKRFDDICQQAAETLNIARVSVWLFEEDKTVLRCISLYILGRGFVKSEQTLLATAYPAYFSHLYNNRVIAVQDAMTDSATLEFAKDYLPKNKISSMLDATLFKHEDVIGVICYEHIGKPRKWRLDEQNFARSVADILCLVLEVEERRSIQKELVRYQNQLEDMVKVRTESLEKSEHRFRSVVQGAPVAIICFTETGVMTEFNPQAEKATGYKAKQALGKLFQEFLVVSEHREKATQLLASITSNMLVSKKSATGTLLNIKHADGRILDFSWHLSSENDRSNESAVVAVGDDITQRKQLEQYLKTAKDAAEAADRLKSMFVASMSHELRTPLNSIIGFIGVVMQGMSGEVNAQQKDHLGRAYQSAKHLLALISDVIDISKIEAQHIGIELDTFSLLSVIESAVADIGHLKQQKDIVLTLDCDPQLMIETDHKRCYQVLLNVLSNAAKYTERGTIKVTVTPAKDRIKIVVEDTGIGMDSAGMKKLFLPFERLDSKLRIKVAGTGLGLYLSQKIVTEILNGSINVTSKLNHGTTVSIILPKVLQWSPPPEHLPIQAITQQ